MAVDRSLIRLAPGKLFAGKFRLEQNFASGGMGSVWRALDTQRNLPVAIKVMSAAVSDSPGFVVRFEREAKAAAQIGSPHVVSIFEYGVYKQLPYIVMELLEGEDLQTRLKRETRLALRPTVRIVRGVCEALHGAHEGGVVHRDLKPANIFLVRSGDADIVKVLDFGIAKLTHDEDGHITATGQMMGTPHYMSPEQIQGAKHVDHRTDLWAIGAIAFRSLTGQLPFTGHTVQVIRAILDDSAPPPTSIVPELPPAMNDFFARALARDIEARFQSAREFSDAFVKAAGREARPRMFSMIDSEEAPPSSMLDMGAAQGPTSAGGAPPVAGKAPTSDRGAKGPTSDRGAAGRSPESLRRVVPVDAPLLPVMLPARESAPPSLDTPAPRSSRTSMASISRAVATPGRRRPWIVWAAAAAVLMLAAALLAMIATATNQDPEPPPPPAPSGAAAH